eukprot:4587911-Lingulodinium_polyedra.AAC.1
MRVRRWGAAFDELTCQAYVGTLGPSNRWMLDAALTWLSKDPDKTDEMEEDERWAQILRESEEQMRTGWAGVEE